MEERAERLALYIIENRTTVRAAAQKFGISKSTVHKDISERLPQFNRALYLQVKEILEHYIRCALSYQNQLLADIKALLQQLAERES